MKKYVWGRFLICLSIVLPLGITVPVGATSRARLRVQPRCEVAIADLIVTDEVGLTSARINGQEVRHLEEPWGDSQEISFTGEATWESGESWSRTETVSLPEKCQGIPPTATPRATEELPPTHVSTQTEVIPSATPTATETEEPTATSVPTYESTPTETATETPGETPATPTATPTSTETPTDEPTLEPSESPTPTETEVAPTPTATEVIPRDCFSGRRASGEGTRIGFCAGEEVFGGSIGLDTGQVCEGGNCWLPIAPVDGWVSSGVVTPWLSEVTLGIEPWIEPACSGRRTSGDGSTAYFCQGEEVFGVDILLRDGSSCGGGSCWLPSAPLGGWVQTGVVEPWDGEVPAGTEPWYPYWPPPPTEIPVPTETESVPDPVWEQNPELDIVPAPALACQTQNGTPTLPEQGGMLICWHSPTDVEIRADRPFNIQLGINGTVLSGLGNPGQQHLRFEDSSSGNFILWGNEVGVRFRADGSGVAKYFETPVLGS